MDANTFVIYEEIKLAGIEFEYVTVIMDKDLIGPMNVMNYGQPKIIFASNRQWPLDQAGDTVRIKGSIEVLNVSGSGLEGQPTDVKIQFTAKFYNSYLASSPYSYDGYERMESSEYVTQDLIVKLNEPRIYGRDNLYLKARIKLLTVDDLAGFSKDRITLPEERNFRQWSNYMQILFRT